jgi:hypothetical protein
MIVDSGRRNNRGIIPNGTEADPQRDSDQHE